MIDPKGIPEIPGNMTFVRHRALRLQRLGADVAGSGADIDSTWQGLAGVYEAPEAGELFAATGLVRTSSAALGDDFSAVGAALVTYADAVDEVKRQLASLRAKADAFVAEHGGSDDWHDDDDAVEHNNYLVHAVSVQVAMFAGAQRTCANAINALVCGLQYTADDGDGVAEPGEFGATADQLDAAAKEPGALPWGSTQKKDRGIAGDIFSYGGGLWDGAKENFWGMTTLVGRDPSGDWSWKAAGESWKNTSTFVLALSPHAQALNRSFDLPGAPKGTLDNTLKDAAKNTVAYDDWGKGDDARAAGKATFNIAGIVGTKGAGAAAKGMGAAAGGSRFGTVAAVSSVLNKTGQALDRVPTMGDAAGAAASKLLPTRGSGVSQTAIPTYSDVPNVRSVPTDPVNPGSVGDQIARADAADSPQHVGPPEGKDAASGQDRPDGTAARPDRDAAPSAGRDRDGPTSIPDDDGLRRKQEIVTDERLLYPDQDPLVDKRAPGVETPFRQQVALAANTDYVVVDRQGQYRGVFHTDHTGRIAEVTTTSSAVEAFQLNRPEVDADVRYLRNGLNPDLKNLPPRLDADGTLPTDPARYTNLLPETTYHVDGRYEITTDALARVQRMEIHDIDLTSTAPRSDSQQRNAADLGRLEFPGQAKWNGGHGDAAAFGGFPEGANQQAMLEDLNQRRTAHPNNYYAFEEEMRGYAKDHDVRRVMTYDYASSSRVTHHIEVQFSIDGGSWQQRLFDNMPPAAGGDAGP